MPRLTLIAPLALAVSVLSGCSIKTMAVTTVANTLADTGDVFSRDDDPELVADAIPFALKLYESLLDSVPNHAPLLVATCSGFTQYAYAFVQTEADILRDDNYERATELDARALKLYLRGRDYCLRALDVRFRGASATLTTDAATTLERAERRDVELLYWTAASWGSAIALAPDRPDLLIDFPAVRALIDRAAVLDDAWSNGSIHEILITFESLESLGGSLDKAREHFARAVELQGGKSPGPYVALATGVSVAKQDRAEFEKLLEQALAIDPDAAPSTRLVTLITQRRARALQAQVGSLFAQ
jgi:predicted anti-sigma-YlaC factor YlaD